ncbi:MAG: DNA-binding transcriptional regulator OxyR [Acidiferrobacterales bacterium]|jgi:LysR family hydrogen peroxide-inducible transcriptional activator|nr:DNA-binding transcriptional regulator OxyR [Acidiferrobacterales bacterium]
MNLRDLEYLVAVDEERHFHKAAERCFVSQPTLSGQLKKLEDELGVLLVERTRRQVVMTDVGEAVANQARTVLADAKAIKDIVQTFDDPMAGELHVGLIPTLAPYLLPQIMPAIRRLYPKLKLWLHEYQTAVLLEKLHRAELDLLILALPVDTDEFAELNLFKESFLLAVPRDEALANEPMISLGELSKREMLLLEEGHCLRGQALDVCFMAGATENVGFHASSLETLRHMVGEGMGITLMPELAVPARQTKQDPIRYLPFQDPKPSRRIGMLYRKGSYREEAFIMIQELVQQTLAEK